MSGLFISFGDVPKRGFRLVVVLDDVGIEAEAEGFQPFAMGSGILDRKTFVAADG
jgi:hypothetical protein